MSEKKQLKNIIIIILSILIITVITITLIYIFKKEPPKEEEKTSYSTKAVSYMKEQDIYELITTKDYSKTIEIMLEEKTFNLNYLDDYYQIEYTNNNDFTKLVNGFLNKNYTPREINYLTKNYTDSYNILLTMNHIDILKFKDLTNYDPTKLERYLDYQQKNTKYDLKTVVTYVNIGLDLKGYSKYSEYTLDQAKNDLTILVNKYHKLPDNYEPDDLTPINNSQNYLLRKEAALNYTKLASAALLDNVIIYPFSAYRSYKTQKALYTNYKNRDGEEQADTYSARPGFSEHQLGLAVDVRSSSLPDNLTPNDYKWMLANSYKYGFIIRYPKGKQHITQFMEEPWHIRYLGVDLATKVHASGLTFDEYYDIYMPN